MVAVVAVFGSLIGSFLNVVVYRVPAGMSLVKPPSACPSCGHRIRPYDNIPVLSWLFLGGRCRDCRTRIPVRYPLVELGTAVLFAVVAFAFLGPLHVPGRSVAATALELVAYLWLAAVTVALAIIDIETHRLPDRIVVPTAVAIGSLLTAAAAVEGDWWRLGQAAIGGLALGGFYLLLAFVRPDAMGLGDVKLAGVLGLALGWAGWAQLAVGAFAAFVLGGVFSVVLLALKRVDRKGGIPFGPWMLAGAWAGIFFGAPLVASYFAVIGLQ
ncbi:prepilin peptidase [Leifsonia sp. AG29]|uniref:prepilin peptidase n=1 Tax=Leifsonia sp. AG29 TaxID=2598860 RepID=UPI00131E568B|nr:A24 family peptidase [Leifsonia sp. AG29]